MTAFNPFSRTELNQPQTHTSTGLLGLVRRILKDASAEFSAAYEKEMANALLPETRTLLLTEPPEDLRKYLRPESGNEADAKPSKSFEVMA